MIQRCDVLTVCACVEWGRGRFSTGRCRDGAQIGIIGGL